MLFVNASGAPLSCVVVVGVVSIIISISIIIIINNNNNIIIIIMHMDVNSNLRVVTGRTRLWFQS